MNQYKKIKLRRCASAIVICCMLSSYVFANAFINKSYNSSCIVAYAAESQSVASGDGKWTKKNGKRYSYRYTDGTYPKGVVKIKNTYYYFKSKGVISTSNKEDRLVTSNGKLYDVKSNGRLRSGWMVFDDELYFFAKTKKAAVTNKIKDGIRLTATGTAKPTLDACLKKRCISTLLKITNRSDSKATKLKKIYAYMTKSSNFHYVIKYPNLNSKNWAKKYAYEMLGDHGGNCYGFACTMAALANEIGCNASVVNTRVHGSRDHASDGFTRHSICYIDGKYYDPEMGWKTHSYIYDGHETYLLTTTKKYFYNFSKFDGTSIVKAEVKNAGKLIKKNGKYYYYDKNGSKRTGTYIIKGNMYIFNSAGYMTVAKFKKYKKLTASGTSFNKLYKYIGKPNRTVETGSSCFDGAGTDWLYYYDDFTVSVFVSDDGVTKIVEGVSAV